METAPRYLQDPPAIEVGDSCSTMEVYEEFDSLAGDPKSLIRRPTTTRDPRKPESKQVLR
jgi:hypothetical protein